MGSDGTTQTAVVAIAVGAIRLEGELTVPNDPRAVIVFAHGTSSNHKSPRNQYVAGVLNESGFATLLIDLVTVEEEAMGVERQFEIGLLAQRVRVITDWVINHSDLDEPPVGYFGASTGAAAALLATVTHHEVVKAVVSRGGRPDLAGNSLPRVKTPTLLIVGGNDGEVLELNRQALERLGGEKSLEIVDGATHLFEETGAMEKVAALAAGWFETHLASGT